MFKDKKILILGFARSGYEAAKTLIKRGNQVIVNDSKELAKEDQDKYEELKKLKVEFIFGSHPDDLLDKSFDYLIKNPGVPIDHKYVLKARSLKIPVINEVEMSYELLPKDKNIKLIAITGTNGKTTTTTLIYEMIKASGKRVHLAGNIGYPFCSILPLLKENDIIVLEVSCQQLENIDKFKPDVSVVTNIDVAHIEFMKSYEHYKETKMRIFENQTKNDLAIVNKGDSELMSCLKGINNVLFKYYSSKEKTDGCYLKDNAIFYEDNRIIDIDSIKLLGMHNYENIMAAVTTVKQFQVDDESICRVLLTFSGVEHRLEFVREVNGVCYYNDTEATNIKCTKIALASFKKPTIIILGGYERDQDFNELKDYSSNIKAILAIGSCRDRVNSFGKSINKKTYVHEHLKDAMKELPKIVSPGDVVLLSPASASWDQYKECEVRGQEFKDIVNKL